MDDISRLLLVARRCAGRTGGGRDEREDLVQETVLRVWRRERERPRRGGLVGLVRTTLAGLLIDRRRRCRNPAPRRAAELLDEPAAERLTPLDDAAWNELRERVRLAIEGLPAPQREVVRLRYYEGLTFKQTADRQDVPLGTALGRMHLALRRLRGELQDEA